MGEREVWLEAARQAGATGNTDVDCPVNGDATLHVEWIPASKANPNEGEYRIWCPECGAQNFLLMRNRTAH